MNKLKKLLLPLLCMMIGVIMLSACEDNNKPQETIKIKLNETSKKLTVGEKFTLTATLTPKGDEAKISWSSSDDKIATVKGGEVTAVGEGTANITAKLENGEEATCKVTVVKKEDDDNTPTPSTLKFKKEEYSVTVGDKLDLKKELESTSEITWSSSDDKIATVKGGEVTAVAEGSATITAELANGAKATCKVTVLKKKDDNNNDPTPTPGDLKFKKEKYTLAVKKTLDLKKELNGGTGKLLWTSYDEDTATVDANGIVTGVADGTVTVSVDTEDGNSAECTIVVGSGVGDDDDDDDNEVDNSTTITFGIPDMDLTEGTSFQLKVIFLPIGANEPITWSSDNESIATVKDGVVTALKPGYANITARISNGSEATIKIIVKEKKEPTVNPLKFKKEKYTLRVGEKLSLKAELEGNTHKLLWLSYDDDIAYVNDNGLVTAIAEGEVEISVDEDPWSASCTIVVIPADSGSDDE